VHPIASSRPADSSRRLSLSRFVWLALIPILAGAAASRAGADLALETETARLLPPGQYTFGSAFEFQTSSSGEEYALPMAFEVGLLERLELMIEPVAVASIHGDGESATGFGDIETTLTGLIVGEGSLLPALGLAGEIKFPSATNEQIGSGEFDYRIYGIASKRFGDFDLHLNAGYNFIGAPSGVRTRNPFDLAFGVEWFLTPRFDLVAEVTYIGSSFRSSGSTTLPGGGESSLTPEIGGEETVGSIGGRFHYSRCLDFFGTFSYDNNDASLIRIGISMRF